MDTESPRALGEREGRNVHCAGRSSPNNSHPILQPFDDVNRLRAELVARNVRPEIAATVAGLLFGGAHG